MVDRRPVRKHHTASVAVDGVLYFVTGDSNLFKGKVFIGHGGDSGPIRGYVTAYDAATGRKLWRFYTVPGNPKNGFENAAMARAAKTWSGDWWRFGGGGAVWNAMAFDEETDTLFIGIGNPYPFSPTTRTNNLGDNPTPTRSSHSTQPRVHIDGTTRWFQRMHRTMTLRKTWRSLRRSPVILSAATFTHVVLECALIDNGMPCFEGFTDYQLDEVRNYLRKLATEARQSSALH